MALTLSEEMLLLVLDDASGRTGLDRTATGFALAGGWLLELALAGQVEVTGRRVRVCVPAPGTSPAPLADAELAALLDRIGRERARKPEVWVRTLAKDARRATEARLVAGGYVRREQRKILGLVPQLRLPALDATAKQQAWARLRTAVVSGGAPDPRTAALAALVHGAGYGPRLFGELPRREVHARLAEVESGTGSWAGQAVRKAIQGARAAAAAAAAG